MKKILSLLSVISIGTSVSSTVISCNDVASLDDYGDKIESNLRSVTVIDPTSDGNYAYDMSKYFDSTGDLLINPKSSVSSDSNHLLNYYDAYNNLSGVSADDHTSLTKKILEEAALVAIKTLNSNTKKDTDVSIVVTGFDDPSKATKATISFTSKSDSIQWKGETSFNLTVASDEKEGSA